MCRLTARLVIRAAQFLKSLCTKRFLDGNPPRPTTCDACLKHCSRSFCIIRALTRAQQGDVETGLVFTGANMWKIKEILPVKEIFRRLKEDIEKI